MLQVTKASMRDSYFGLAGKQRTYPKQDDDSVDPFPFFAGKLELKELCAACPVGLVGNHSSNECCNELDIPCISNCIVRGQRV